MPLHTIYLSEVREMNSQRTISTRSRTKAGNILDHIVKQFNLLGKAFGVQSRLIEANRQGIRNGLIRQS